MMEGLPVVAVVGRPNVGKSTFFNRVIGSRVAIVDDQPGVTRDRNFAHADWAGRGFRIVDTGGVVEGSDVGMDVAIRDQAMIAVEQADVILFLVDGKTGVREVRGMVGAVSAYERVCKRFPKHKKLDLLFPFC